MDTSRNELTYQGMSIRFISWAVIALASFVLMIDSAGEGFVWWLFGSPEPESRHHTVRQPQLTWATALYVLSLIPLLWPKSCIWLQIIAALWFAFGGVLLLFAW